ncbi:MAG TPA: hypothetical protein VL652_34785 [Kutzneria sp.]|nr:hypothetical protein [Kutzneria sp.]
MPDLRAVIWVPEKYYADRQHRIGLCVAYCARRGYLVVGIVTDGGAAGWADATQMCFGDTQAEVIVVGGRREDLPLDRLPRSEFIGEEGQEIPGQRRGWRRRPRIIDR